jgi:hypothetical protein
MIEEETRMLLRHYLEQGGSKRAGMTASFVAKP